MIHLGAQYYRPPFPVKKHWENDFRLMSDSGLNTVQLWIVWGWVEATPGTYDFADYQELVEMADKAGLKVVLSTIGAIHPYWIHREIPGSEMVDSTGRTVVSSNRRETHFGLTPGGCLDHPQVWEAMRGFLRACAETFKDSPNLVGWDAWNELRWNVQAEGMVCFCDHSVRRYRRRLEERYGDLEGLNRHWKRRYSSWDDVTPGRLPGTPYTDLMAFQEFITWRSNQHALDRYKTLKEICPELPVTVHGGIPTVFHSTDGFPNTALHRGNDWVFAEQIDGIGCSSFPRMFGNDGWNMRDGEFFFRLESLRSAAGTKRIWISELQGGRGNVSFDLAEPVPAEEQQRWLWKGLSVGAEKVLFWCWRDEVFGRESNGFGIVGNDGYKEERLSALKRSSKILSDHRDLFSHYRAGGGEVGIVFSPTSVYLLWAQEGNGKRYLDSLQGYAEALQRLRIPYSFVEERHTESLDGIKALFAPACHALPQETRTALARWVEQGGVLITEPEFAAFSETGFYDSVEERWIHRWLETGEVGRRKATEDSITIAFREQQFRLPAGRWVTPFSGHENDLLAEKRIGRGTVIMLGAFLGEAAQKNLLNEQPAGSWHSLLTALLQEASVRPLASVQTDPVAEQGEDVHLVPGTSGGRNVLFVFAPKQTDSVTLRFTDTFFHGKKVRDIVSERDLPIHSQGGGETIVLEQLTWRMAVLVSDE